MSETTEYRCNSGDGATIQCRAISGSIEMFSDSNGHLATVYLSPADAIAFARDILAAAGADLPAAPARVVEVTAEDVAGMSGVHSHDKSVSINQARADWLTRRLNARTPSPLVRRPTKPVTALVVPEDGWYTVRTNGKRRSYYGEVSLYKAGYVVTDDDVDGLLRLDTDAPTTWVERSQVEEPADWTAETTPANDRPFWYWNNGTRFGKGAVLQQSCADGRTQWMKSYSVTAWCYVTLPEVAP